MSKNIIPEKISTCLWFDRQAEEAATFYCSVFKNSDILRIAHYGKAGFEQHGMKEGTVATVEFRLEGRDFMALNAGPHFKFNEAVSLVVNCETQEELDYYWDTLSEGGDPSAQVCGWLKDKFGVSWQIVPIVLQDMFADPDRKKSDQAMAAMLKMKKMDIAALTAAFNK